MDGCGRRRLENGALAEELARAPPSLFEIYGVFLGGSAIGEPLARLLEKADGVTIRRIELHGKLELFDRLFQLFGGDVFLTLLHVIGAGVHEGALESQAIFDVARVFVDGARVKHDGSVSVATLGSVAAFSMSAASGIASENAESWASRVAVIDTRSSACCGVLLMVPQLA